MNDKKSKRIYESGSIWNILSFYKLQIGALFIFAIIGNGLSLWIPKIIASGIDSFTLGNFSFLDTFQLFIIVSLGALVFSYIQNIFRTFVGERVARDMRQDLVAVISKQNYSYVQNVTPSKLLTHLTSDVDAVKLFVSLATVTIFSSVVLIIGASILLLTIDWQLALVVLLLIPAIAIVFWRIFSKMGPFFRKTQEIIDSLNKVINESILGSALVRILNSEQAEFKKFLVANTNAKNNELKIINLFASLTPIVTLIANIAIITILSLGGYFVIGEKMTIGSFTAFVSYVSILIFPIIIIGFMSNVIGRASASYKRIQEVLVIKDDEQVGTIQKEITGDFEVKNLTLSFGEKPVLKNISFKVKKGTRNAIIGPTAGGKTQLLYVLNGLSLPEAGDVFYDGISAEQYDSRVLRSQIGFVFQDSILFNLSLKENIAFGDNVTDESLNKAIDTAELHDFIGDLPDGLDTLVSERGISLSGGQKQRIMLARALSVNPKILFLDDFTSRVDALTEKNIIENLKKNYPDLTLLSVTQKISSVEHYENIIVLMEGEKLAEGTHKKLLKTSVEYAQIFNSQQSMNTYEL